MIDILKDNHHEEIARLRTERDELARGLLETEGRAREYLRGLREALALLDTAQDVAHAAMSGRPYHPTEIDFDLEDLSNLARADHQGYDDDD